MKCSDSQRHQALLHLYDHTHAEITRYRDYEWKITSWSLVLFAGIVAATNAVPVHATHRVCVQTLLMVITVVLAAYGLWHIYFVHKQLVWNQCLRRRMEVFFGLFDEKLCDGKTILPAHWRPVVPPFFDHVSHIGTFWSLIVLGAIYVLYSIRYMNVLAN